MIFLHQIPRQNGKKVNFKKKIRTQLGHRLIYRHKTEIAHHMRLDNLINFHANATAQALAVQ